MADGTHHGSMRIAICGGGIGGLYAALALHHHCHDKVAVDVYEQASEFKEIGAGVGLAVNAARLMHKIGLGTKLNNAAGFRNGTWITFRRYDNGHEIITIPANDKNEIRQAPVARSDLLDILRFGIEDRKAATLHTKKKVIKLDDNGGSVTLHFEDGTTAVADVVIGADGIHSNVRNQFIHDKPIYSGRVAYRATLPISNIEPWWPFDTYSVLWCQKSRHFLVFPISQNKTLNVVAFNNVDADEAKDVVESWVSTCDRREVEEAYREFEPSVQKLIAQMDDKPSRWKINDREPFDRWHFMNGKVILLGDAAHAMLPHLGAGAGQSVEDGWVLARAFSELLNGTDNTNCGDLESCAAFYQKVRLPRAQKVQNTSRKAGARYNLDIPEMKGKTYDECLPILSDMLKTQMQFVWEAELDSIYDDAKKDPKETVTSLPS